MNEEMKEKLVQAGINVDEGVSRFLDDTEMFCELLLKFFEINQLSELEKEAEAGNVIGAFDAAHSLKGVCGNLSMDSLSEIIKPMVEVLRIKKDNGVLTDELTEVKEEYKKLAVVYEDVEKVVKEVLA